MYANVKRNILCSIAGENDYWYRYTLIKLNWNGNDFSFFFTFSSAAALVGN